MTEPLGASALIDDVRTIVGFGWRRNGCPAARTAAEFMRTRFESAGLETSVETWPFNMYYPREWSVGVAGTDEEANSIPIWYSAAGAVEGPALHIDARRGVPDLSGIDLSGRILLVDVDYVGNFLPTDGSSSADAGLYGAAVRAGAIGYIRRAGAPGNSVMLMHLAQNFATHAAPARLGGIPALTVGSADFTRLVEKVADGADIRLNIALCEVPKGGDLLVDGGALGPGSHLLRATVDDVIGVLPGCSDEVIVIAAHYDSTFDGAVDNATGCAVLLGLLGHFAALDRSDRPKTLVFLASGAHDTGDFDLYHFVERHREDILARTVAFNWLDHMAADAAEAAPGNTVAHGVLASENAVLRSHVVDHLESAGIPIHPLLGPASTIGHLPPEVPSYNITLAPSWYHSPEDTVEKVPAAALATMAAAQLRIVQELMVSDGAELRAANREPQDSAAAALAAAVAS
ncbi:hypothetical protein GCM10010458_21840 [Microbacterium luteolum]|uniref:M28 family peptidase n=1 Tax=Microbacterium luteolum TaxID=69367 RepID=A0ABY7XRQ7_MICLT|nr:M28 family peptidase [Microbacterium luteolum]WDM44846.1 M28 family peptidase [Microbacterium luteolum]